MTNPLTARQTPAELAASQQVIEIAEEISSFERLAATVGADLAALEAGLLPADWRKAAITGRLGFDFSGPDVAVLEGAVAATVYAVCQRCLQPMPLPLAAELRLSFGEQELPGYECWELDEQTLRPVDIVDEALVMAMPMSALHDSSHPCGEQTANDAGQEEKIRPFAALRSQMADKSAE